MSRKHLHGRHPHVTLERRLQCPSAHPGDGRQVRHGDRFVGALHHQVDRPLDMPRPAGCRRDVDRITDVVRLGRQESGHDEVLDLGDHQATGQPARRSRVQLGQDGVQQGQVATHRGGTGEGEVEVDRPGVGATGHPRHMRLQRLAIDPDGQLGAVVTPFHAPSLGRREHHALPAPRLEDLVATPPRSHGTGLQDVDVVAGIHGTETADLDRTPVPGVGERDPVQLHGMEPHGGVPPTCDIDAVRHEYLTDAAPGLVEVPGRQDDVLGQGVGTATGPVVELNDRHAAVPRRRRGLRSGPPRHRR